MLVPGCPCPGFLLLILSVHLCVMRPQSQHFYNMLILEDLIDQAMLNIDTSGIGTTKVTDKLLYGGGFWKGSVRNISSKVSALGFNPAAASFLASFCACFV